MMVLPGMAAAAGGGLDGASAKAVIFSGATRNSLVVLPLALPGPLALVSLVVLIQTLWSS
ncbi:Putative sodium-dependent transporter [Arthrobacter sp. DR-2P]|nr:Putative sodium-dependent transporter [Arthrobacter sp. DR-2P]